MKRIVTLCVVIAALVFTSVAAAGWNNGWYQTRTNIQRNIHLKWGLTQVTCYHGTTADHITVNNNVYWTWFGCAGTDDQGVSWGFRALITGGGPWDFRIAHLSRIG